MTSTTTPKKTPSETRRSPAAAWRRSKRRVLADARLSDPAQTVVRTTRVYGHADDYRTGVVVTRLRDGSDYATVFEIGKDESACAARLTRKIGGRAAAPPPELGK